MTIENITPLEAEETGASGINWTHLIVHHTGAEERNAEQVRRFHKSLGWSDVGYHYLIERNGEIVAGRSLGLPGAHTRTNNMNRRGIGICLIGNFERRKPTKQQYQGLNTLLLVLMSVYNIAPENILGHNEVIGSATACPGRLFDKQALRPVHLNVQGRNRNVNVRLNNQGITEMFVTSRKLWIPVAETARLMGGTVSWNEKTRRVTITF